VALSTTITRWSLLRSWVLILKELRNLLPSFMFNLSITLPNLQLSTPDVPFPALLSTLAHQHDFRSSLQPSRPPLVFFGGGGVLRYPVPKWLFFLYCLRSFFFLPSVRASSSEQTSSFPIHFPSFTHLFHVSHGRFLFCLTRCDYRLPLMPFEAYTALTLSLYFLKDWLRISSSA